MSTGNTENIAVVHITPPGSHHHRIKKHKNNKEPNNSACKTNKPKHYAQRFRLILFCLLVVVVFAWFNLIKQNDEWLAKTRQHTRATTTHNNYNAPPLYAPSNILSNDHGTQQRQTRKREINSNCPVRLHPPARHRCVQTSWFKHAHQRTHAHTRAHTHTRTHARTHTHTYIDTCIYIYIYVYVYIYIYIIIFTHVTVS